MLSFLLSFVGWTQALTELLMSKKFGFICLVSIIWLWHPGGSQAVFWLVFSEETGHERVVFCCSVAVASHKTAGR